MDPWVNMNGVKEINIIIMAITCGTHIQNQFWLVDISRQRSINLIKSCSTCSMSRTPATSQKWGHKTTIIAHVNNKDCLLWHTWLRHLWQGHEAINIRDHFVYTPSQWEMTLQCNVISHWLDAYTRWSRNMFFLSGEATYVTVTKITGVPVYSCY